MRKYNDFDQFEKYLKFFHSYDIAVFNLLKNVRKKVTADDISYMQQGEFLTALRSFSAIVIKVMSLKNGEINVLLYMKKHENFKIFL